VRNPASGWNNSPKRSNTLSAFLKIPRTVFKRYRGSLYSNELRRPSMTANLEN
jgi:hypothetical protein